MPSESIPRFVGQSDLPEDELASLWRRLREKWPTAHAMLTSSNSDSQEHGEVGWDAAIHDVLRETDCDLPSFPEQHLRYVDMRHFLHWRRLKAILDHGRILTDNDYWTVRNGLDAFSDQLSPDLLSRLQQLILAYPHPN